MILQQEFQLLQQMHITCSLAMFVTVSKTFITSDQIQYNKNKKSPANAKGNVQQQYTVVH